MNCKICGTPYESGETICKNCGCDLPRINTATAENKKETAEQKSEPVGLTPIDIARNDIIRKGDEHNRLLLTLKILLIASFMFFVFPFTTYQFSGLNEDVANGLNALIGQDVYEAEPPEPKTLSGFGHLNNQVFEDINGLEYSIGNSIYVVLAIFFVAVSILFCFLPLQSKTKFSIITTLCILGLFLLLYHLMTSSTGGVKATMEVGFYLEFIIILASTAISAYLKYTD